MLEAESEDDVRQIHGVFGAQSLSLKHRSYVHERNGNGALPVHRPLMPASQSESEPQFPTEPQDGSQPGPGLSDTSLRRVDEGAES
jgi:hypothetical protein